MLDKLCGGMKERIIYIYIYIYIYLWDRKLYFEWEKIDK